MGNDLLVDDAGEWLLRDKSVSRVATSRSPLQLTVGILSGPSAPPEIEECSRERQWMVTALERERGSE